MFGRLLVLFLLVPIADLALLVAVGDRLGFWPTLGVIAATALAGSWLARREGLAAWQRVQAKLTGGGLPGPEMIDGLVILVAGALLLTPGFLTDLAGLLGLFPPTRALARRALAARFAKGVRSGAIRVASAGRPFGGPGPIDAAPIEDAEIVDDGRPPGPSRTSGRTA